MIPEHGYTSLCQAQPDMKLFSLADCSHNVTIHTFAAKIWGFQNVHRKPWETRLGQEKLHYLFVLCIEGVIVWPGFTLACRSTYEVRTRCFPQLFRCKRKNKFLHETEFNNIPKYTNIPRDVAITDEANNLMLKERSWYLLRANFSLEVHKQAHNNSSFTAFRHNTYSYFHWTQSYLTMT